MRSQATAAPSARYRTGRLPAQDLPRSHHGVGRGRIHIFQRRCFMVTLADARRVIAAAEAKAADIGQPMNIAVVDAGGNLVAHVRMDNAWIGSVDISIDKAWTSRAFDVATHDLA